MNLVQNGAESDRKLSKLVKLNFLEQKDSSYDITLKYESY